MAKNASKACARELNSFGALPKAISVVAGQSDLLICQATYDTPKGQSHVLIPIEIKNDTALMPSMFLSTAGFVNLTKSTLNDHLKATAGKNYKADVQKLLESISNVKNGSPKTLSDIEQIVIKTASSNGTPTAHLANNVLLEEIDAANPNVETPTLQAPEEVRTIAAMLVSDAGAAEFKFSKPVVDMGRKLILSEMQAAGYGPNTQVVVADNTEDSISYAVAVDGKFGFNVPVKVVNSTPHLPSVVVSAGRVFDLSPSGIGTLLSDGDTNPRAVAQASSFYGLRPSELVDRIRSAMFEENYMAAEDALHVLKVSGDEIAYKAGFNAYTKGLCGDGESPSQGCDTPVKLASSKHMVCSHTGLPVHNVYKDEHGNCRPLYRKRMKDSSEGGGVSFIHSRVYFE